MTATELAAWVVHRAGPRGGGGLQLCTQCGATIGDRPPGYPKRAQVARLDGDEGVFVTVQLDGELLDDMRLCTEAR